MRLPPLFIFLPAILAAQAHPAWRHYTLDNGLPDNNIYGMCEDSIGHLWFATDAGIARFDGYSFRKFSAPDEINSASVFSPQADSLGRVWFRSIADKLYYVENDSIHLWQWNHLLEKYRGKAAVSTRFSMFEGNSVMLQFIGMGMVRVFADGRVAEVLSDSTHMVWAKLSGSGNGVFSAKSNMRLPEFLKKTFLDHKITQPSIVLRPYTRPDTLAGLPNNQSYGAFEQAIGLAPRHYIFFAPNMVAETKNGQLVRYRRLFGPDRNVVSAQILPDGRLALACINNLCGIWVFKNVEALFADRPDTVLLRGEQTTGLHIDCSGGLWTTTLRNGVFYLPNPGIAILDQKAGLPEGGATCLVAGAAGQLFFANAQEIFEFDTRGLQLKKLPKPAANRIFIKYLFYDDARGNLMLGSDRTMSWTGRKWQVAFPVSMENSRKVFPLSNAMLPSRDGRFFYGIGVASTGIQKVDRKSGAYVFDARKPRSPVRVKAITETPDGRIWAANADGLQEWVGDSVLRPVAARPAPLDHRIGQMVWTNDGVLVAATMSGGVCFWEEGLWSLQVTEADGLTGNNVKCLVLQGDSIVWAGGNAGLNKITGWRPGQKLRVEQLTIAHGLPTNQINQLCVADGFLWAATSDGLVRLGEMSQKYPPAKPILAEIFVKNKKWAVLGGATPEFSASENDVEFRFYALNFRQNGRIPYRFRLNKNASWQTGQATSALFSSLAPGEYRFEVQAQNEDGIWGEHTIFPFEIRPSWWASWPFRSAMALLFLGGVFAFYKYRTLQLEEKFVRQKQVSELEQTALRAQMNPHFIANCLNSIQLCVLANNNEAAIRSLARFGKLVRTALEFSGRPLISLREELVYLENYLELEKLRFKQKFDYQIKVSEGLDLGETVLPPMLVQPLAENAIEHGFAGTRSGGLLEISFLKKGDGLEIWCADNGQGLPHGFAGTENAENPHALQLVRRRLELLGEMGGRPFFEIRNRADGQTGTVAIFTFG